MSDILEIASIFLIITIIVMVCFLTKLLFDVSKLVKNLDDTTAIVKRELGPALKELNKTISKVNELTDTTDRRISSIKSIITSLLGASTIALCGLKNISGGLVNGFLTGLKLFMKK